MVSTMLSVINRRRASLRRRASSAFFRSVDFDGDADQAGKTLVGRVTRHHGIEQPAILAIGPPQTIFTVNFRLACKVDRNS